MKYANKNEVEHLLLKSDVSNYRISKDTGIGEGTLNKYKRGEADIENMTFGNAIKLQQYYLKLKEENKLTDKMSREEVFGRAFGVLNIISERHFEKNKPNAETKYMVDFDRKPMTVYFRAHKDVMDYAHKFDEIDLALLDRINEYIGNMDTNEYNDDPLEPVFLHYKADESIKLRNLIKNNELLK